MRKLTKIIVIFLFVTVVFVGKNVYAEEVYYTNRSGVEFTREQYDFYTYLTHEGFQENVTQDMLDEINWDDLDSMDVKVVRMCPMQSGHMGNVNSTQDDNLYVATNYMGLSIAKYCTQHYCRVVNDVDWFGEPTIKSHDVLGSFLDGPTRLSPPSTFVTSSTSATAEEMVKYESDGFGAIFQVPTGEDVYITQSFIYSGTGTVFSSYQHAMEHISYENAQLFNIDFSGYGNVFDFYGAARGVYDNLPGVSIDV